MLELISDFGWTLGFFLLLLFSDFSHLKVDKEKQIEERTKRHAGFVSNFLKNTPVDSSHSVQSIVSAMYKHYDSVPLKHRDTDSRPTPPSKDHISMARHQLLLRARQIVLSQILSEVSGLIKHPSLRMAASQQSWESVLTFSLTNLEECVRLTAPSLYVLLVGAATPPTGNSGNERTLNGRNPRLVSWIHPFVDQCELKGQLLDCNCGNSYDCGYTKHSHQPLSENDWSVAVCVFCFCPHLSSC